MTDTAQDKPRYWLVPFKELVDGRGPRRQYELIDSKYWGGLEIGKVDEAWKILVETLADGLTDAEAINRLKDTLSRGRNFPIFCNPIAPKGDGLGNFCEYGLGVDLVGLEGILKIAPTWKAISEEQYRTQYFG